MSAAMTAAIDRTTVPLAYGRALRDAQAFAGRGMSNKAILAALRAENVGGRYDPCLMDSEIEACVDEATRPRVARAVAVADGRVAAEGQPCKLSVLTSSPPVWTLTWELGQVVRVSSEQLLAWSRIQVEYLNQNHQEARWTPSREKWNEVRAELMDRLEVEEAGEELTLRGAVLDFLRGLVARPSRTIDRLPMGGVYLDDENARYVVLASFLVHAIENGAGGSSVPATQGLHRPRGDRDHEVGSRRRAGHHAHRRQADTRLEGAGRDPRRDSLTVTGEPL